MKITIEYYSNLFRKYGYDPRSLSWGLREGKQGLQFEILCEIGKITNCSILEVGCGFGDLFGYLKFRKVHVQYTGIDLNSDFVKIGKKVYPGINLRVGDFEKYNFKKKFDWVFFSGISSPGCSYPYIKRIMTKMFNLCKKGIAINFVGGVLDYREKGFFYSDPEKIYNLTRTISNRVVIRHDYAPFQFALYIYKNNTKTPNNIFKEYLKNSKMKFDDSLWHPMYKKTIYRNVIRNV